MKKHMMRRQGTPLLLLLLTILTGCSEPLPAAAKEALFDGFEAADKATIHSAEPAQLLQEDLDLGATEVWCVNVTFACWSCDYGEWHTCADSRLMRLIDGEWQVSLVVSDEDAEKWQARGCELIEGTVSR
jgi:hypothetical protein